MSPRELKVLLLLQAHRKGLYASELIYLSQGFVERSTAYTLLKRMVDKGWLLTVLSPSEIGGEPRPLYKPSLQGASAVQEFLNLMGLMPKPVIGESPHGTS